MTDGGAPWQEEAEGTAAATLREKLVLFAEAEHKLKTGLTIVIGWASLLDTDWDSLSAQHRKHGLSMILRRAEAMARESEELLAIVRAEAMQATRPRRIRLRTQLQYTASNFGCAAASHPVTVEVSGSPVAWVDPGVLDQVLENLVENAMKYSPAGGKIELRACASPGHADCVIEVVDQGVGIPLGVDIFAPFTRGSASSTDIVGSGLGLHVVATLVRSMNGSVDAHRNVDAGSTFTLRVPRHQPRLPTEGSV